MFFCCLLFIHFPFVCDVFLIFHLVSILKRNQNCGVKEVPSSIEYIDLLRLFVIFYVPFWLLSYMVWVNYVGECVPVIIYFWCVDNETTGRSCFYYNALYNAMKAQRVQISCVEALFHESSDFCSCHCIFFFCWVIVISTTLKYVLYLMYWTFW